MEDVNRIVGELTVAILETARTLGFEVVGVGNSTGVEFHELSHRGDWPPMYRASVDLVDAEGAGNLQAVVGEVFEGHPPRAEQLRETGALCEETIDVDGAIIVTSSWKSPDLGSEVLTNRVIRIACNGIFVDIISSNQDSNSSMRSRLEPPFDMAAARKIALLGTP